MGDRRTRKWCWRIGAVVLVGGLILGASSVVTQAANRDDDRHQVNPFDRILHKLDKILDAIKDGGSQDGNHTLRWDTNHPSASRFVKLAAFNNEAVLDKNTGLVWEQAQILPKEVGMRRESIARKGPSAAHADGGCPRSLS